MNTNAKFNEVRFNEVTGKLLKMWKAADENGKDNLVVSLKTWLAANRKSEDTSKIAAIQCFLADRSIF